MILPLLLSLLNLAHAAITLPSHLSSGAVLQTWRGNHVATHIYGTASPGELVTVSCSVPGVPPFSALADAGGAWQIAYNWPPGPTDWDSFDLTVAGTDTPAPLALRGVRWGDVVLCLGDEAAALPTSATADAASYLAAPATQRALSYARLFTGSAWVNASAPGAAAAFSGLCLRSALAATQAQGFGGNAVVGIVVLAAAGGLVEEYLPPAGIAALAGCAPLRGAPPAPGARYPAAALALTPFRYFAISLGSADAAAGRLASTADAAAYACRLRALVAGLRDGAAVGDAPALLLEPPAAALPPGDAALAAARLAHAALLPGAPGGVGACALASGEDTAGTGGSGAAGNVTARAARAARALAYTAWWSTAAPGAGPVLLGGEPYAPGGASAVLLRFALGVAGNGSSTGGALALLRVPASAPARCPRALPWGAGAEGPWLAANVSLGPPGSGGGASLVAVPADAAVAQPPAFVRYLGGRSSEPGCVIIDSATGLPAPAFLARVAPAAGASSGASALPLPLPLPSPSPAPQAPTPAPTPLPSGQPARRAYLVQAHARRLAPPRAPPLGIAPTPPMYFNTWQAFRCNLDEDLLLRTGKALVASGLAAAGYSRVHMDDCEWRAERAASTGAVVPDETRFPSGMPALVAGLRALNLTLGVYTSATSSTCVGRPGSYMNEAVDAATWCAWGAAAIKIDNCGGHKYAAANTSWLAFRAALAACPQPVLLSVESCGDAECAAWIGATGAQMFRTTADMQLYWQSVVENLDNNEHMAPLTAPGLYADPDMLVVGHPGFSPAETRSHIAAWALIAAPLGLSFDLVQGQSSPAAAAATAALVALLTNRGMLGVSQDPAAIAGVRASAANATGGECWARPLRGSGSAPGASSALLLFNRGAAAADVACAWEDALPHLPAPSAASARVVDAWSGQDLGTHAGGFTASALGSHDSLLVLVTPV